MKAQYIKRVKKNLAVSGKEKKEILRDLEEIFGSAAEHGEAEAVVIERLGTPEGYAAEANRAFGCENKGGSNTLGFIAKILVAVVALVFAVFSFAFYNLVKTPMLSTGIIGGADGPTAIFLANPSSPGSETVLLVLAGVALLVFVLMLVSLIRGKKKRG